MSLRAAVAALAVAALGIHAPPARAEEAPELGSRLGAWQVHLHVLVGVEPVDSAHAVAFGAAAELLWRCRVGVFAALLSSKGNAVLATVDNGVALPAPGDRVSVPIGVVVHPLGHLGRRPGDGVDGWLRRLAAGIGVEAGISVEHLRTSGDSATHPGFHGALSVDVPLWGGPVEGGVALRLYGRLIAAPATSLEGGAVEMPSVGGQVYGGLTWAL